MKLAVVLAAASFAVWAPGGWLATFLLLLLVTAWATLPGPARRGLLRFAASAVAVAGLLYGALGPAPSTVRLGPFGFAGHDVEVGLQVGARLAALFATFALGARFVPGRELLPFATRGGLLAYGVGTLLRLVPTIRADATRLREAQAARGHRFRTGPWAARSWLPLLVPLFVLTLRRAREQGLALHLAGVAPDSGPSDVPGRRAHRWATVMTLAALAVAGRLALAAVPGVSLSYFVLFITGVAFGPLTGLLVGATARAATDLALSGLNPIIYLMVPVEAFVGLACGVLGRVANFGQRDREPYAYAALLAATAGWAMVVLFSVAADTLTWLALPLMPGVPDDFASIAWGALVLSGLAFNIPAMIFNAVLFSVATYPVLRALRGSGSLAPHPHRVRPRRAPVSGSSG